jgi:hypothetical protein
MANENVRLALLLFYKIICDQYGSEIEMVRKDD